jgi:hypothetical protein
MLTPLMTPLTAELGKCPLAVELGGNGNLEALSIMEM